MSANRPRTRSGERGGVLVEATAGILMFLLVLFGIVEFSYAFYQWNAATKAMQIGARVAAVSDPVADGLKNITGFGGGTVLPGETYASGDQFVITCTGSDQKCVCSNSKCGGTSNFTYLSGNMSAIVAAMQKAFPRVQTANVKIVYEFTGLGYAGRPGGPVPTITVSMTGLKFDFILLSPFVRNSQINMPAFATTVTGEDMTSG